MKQIRWHRIPKPESDEEFSVMSMAIYGVPLHVRNLEVGRYEIMEPYNLYNAKREGSTQWYDVNRKLCERAFGKLSCGGIATHAYGTTTLGHRHRCRLRRWVKSRSSEGKEQPYKLRSPFVRLAAQLRERREQNYSR